MQIFGLRRTHVSPHIFQQACRASTHVRSRRSVRGAQERVAQPAAAHLEPPRPKDRSQARYEQRRASQEDEEIVRVKWFEKDMSTGITRRVSGNPEEAEARDLRQEIRNLQAELKAYQSDDAGFDETMLEALEPHERVKVEMALQDRRDKEMALTNNLDIPLELPPLATPIIRRLNKCLHEAALRPKDMVRRKELWRWYCRGKRNVPTLTNMLPERAWEVLWTVNAQRGITNLQREAHLIEIADDMKAAGVELSPRQKQIHGYALAKLNRADTAIQIWEVDYKDSAGREQEVLERGISLFTQTRDLTRATKLYREYMNNFTTAEPRVVHPLIRAHVELGNERMAFALYMHLRANLRFGMQMADYDEVIAVFLDYDQRDIALAVFRDMMIQGTNAVQSKAFPRGSQEETALWDSLMERVEGMRNMSLDVKDVNRISLQAMSNLPHEWQNKFFFASWIKKLLGDGHIVYAEKVVELMYERHIRPSAKHLNGLLGAYLRSGDAELEERGEKLGWSMVQKRLNMVAERDHTQSELAVASSPVLLDPESDLRIPLDLSKPIPYASLETWNVLGLHYLIKENWSALRLLQRQLRHAQIPMKGYFLGLLLYMQLYINGPTPLWKDFLYFARDVSPEMETFNCLWTGQLRHLDRYIKTEGHSEYPTPRRLFHTMLAWQHDLTGRSRADSLEAFNREIYAKIVQSFCSAKDLYGSLVAIHAVAARFDIYPDYDIARIITTGLSNLSVGRAPTILGRRGRRPLAVDKPRTMELARLLKAIADRRKDERRDAGIAQSAKISTRENLNILSELIRFGLIRDGEDADEVERAIEKASMEMGVPGINTGDADALNARNYA